MVAVVPHCVCQSFGLGVPRWSLLWQTGLPRRDHLDVAHGSFRKLDGLITMATANAKGSFGREIKPFCKWASNGLRVSLLATQTPSLPTQTDKVRLERRRTENVYTLHSGESLLVSWCLSGDSELQRKPIHALTVFPRMHDQQ